MTNDEAKKKVCPFRAMWGETRNGESYFQDGNCIATDCMMWNEELKLASTTYVGGCGLKTTQGI